MTKMICTENDADCPSYSNKQCTFDGHCSLKEEENKMKCPKCGHLIGFPEGCVCPESYKKPNPSPRDIFQHIANHSDRTPEGAARNACERKAFDEFMITCTSDYGCNWEKPLSDVVIDWIKKIHSDWYSWLVSKGLVQKEKVKREVRINGVLGKAPTMEEYSRISEIPNGAEYETTYRWEE